MPNRVHTLQGLMYSIFLEKHRAAMVSGSAWALTAWSTTPPPTRVHQQNLGPTLLIPFPAPFLMVSKGWCFHISLPQNKTGIFLVLHGTYCTLQFIIFIQWGTQPNWHHHMSRQNPLRSAATHFPRQHHTAKWDGRKKMVHGLSQHPPNTTACGDTNTEPPWTQHGRPVAGSSKRDGFSHSHSLLAKWSPVIHGHISTQEREGKNPCAAARK